MGRTGGLDGSSHPAEARASRVRLGATSRSKDRKDDAVNHVVVLRSPRRLPRARVGVGGETVEAKKLYLYNRVFVQSRVSSGAGPASLRLVVSSRSAVPVLYALLRAPLIRGALLAHLRLCLVRGASSRTAVEEVLALLRGDSRALARGGGLGAGLLLAKQARLLVLGEAASAAPREDVTHDEVGLRGAPPARGSRRAGGSEAAGVVLARSDARRAVRSGRKTRRPSKLRLCTFGVSKVIFHPFLFGRSDILSA